MDDAKAGRRLMMGHPTMRPPLPDGVYWTKADSGDWIPLEVSDGKAYRLVRKLLDGIPSGEVSGATMGPLCKPGTPR